MENNKVFERWFPNIPKKSNRHRGKLFEFIFQDRPVYALCIGRYHSINYLMKWYPMGTHLDDIEPYDTKEFKYKYFELDREIRRKNARVVRQYKDFQHPWPDLWEPDTGSELPEYADRATLLHQFTYELVSIFDPRLDDLSLAALAPIEVIEDNYADGLSARVQLEVFRKRAGNMR